MQNLKNLDGLSVVAIDLDIWSGQTKLEDLDLSLQENYNQEVVKLGNKRLVSRQVLRPFDRIKSAVRRQMLRRGVPFLTGYAIPASQLEDCIKEIEKLKIEFDNAVSDFVSDYDKNLEAWISQNPQDESAIRRGALPLKAVTKRFGFTWDAFAVQSVEHEQAKKNLDGTTGQLGSKLISSVQDAALDFWNRNLRGRSSVGITCHLTLREMKSKLDGLSFLDARTKPLIALLDRVIDEAARPESKCGRQYVEPFFSQLTSAVLILADNNRMNEYLDGYEQHQQESLPSLLEGTGTTTVVAATKESTEMSSKEFFSTLLGGSIKAVPVDYVGDTEVGKPVAIKPEAVVEDEIEIKSEAVVEDEIEIKPEVVTGNELETPCVDAQAPVGFGFGLGSVSVFQ